MRFDDTLVELIMDTDAVMKKDTMLDSLKCFETEQHFHCSTSFKRESRAD